MGRASREKLANAKPEALEQARAMIVRARREGLSLQAIAELLTQRGIHTNRYAVDRFCKKHAIPYSPQAVEIATESPSAPRATPTPTQVESKSLTNEDREPVYESFPLSGLGAEATPAAEPSPTGRSDLAEPPRQVRPNAAMELVFTVHVPSPPVMTTTIAPPQASSEEITIARVLAEMTPIAERIEAARVAGDGNALQTALHQSAVWLESIASRVPEFVRDRVRQALEETYAIQLGSCIAPATPAPDPSARPSQHVAGMGSSSLEPPPLFTPLPRAPVWTLDLPLLTFNDGADEWTLQDACEGTFIVGATGSGKTSGSGSLLARSFLSSGFGGLVLTVKPDERQLWEKYARDCGRAEQLCIVEPGGNLRFNFLDYEARRGGGGGGGGGGGSKQNLTGGGGLIENLVSLFHAVMEAHDHHAGTRGTSSGDGFWLHAGKQLLRNVFRVLVHARERLSLDDLRVFVTEAPQHESDAADGHWKRTEHFGPWLDRAMQRVKGTPDARVIDEARRYWLSEFPALAPNTRSCLVTALTAMADAFVEPVLHELLCTDTTITPEAVMDGAVIVIDLPIKSYKSVGLFAQVIWKHVFQETIESRTDPNDPTRRPVFLWVDEAQFFRSPGDVLFQSTARSSRCATVYLTQNLPGFAAGGGGGGSRGGSIDTETAGLLGSLCTKIIHASNDPATNAWAAEQIGKSTHYKASVSSGGARENDNQSQSGWVLLDLFRPRPAAHINTSSAIEFDVQPSEFTQLRTGSAKYNGFVDAYVVKAGTKFSNGKHYFKGTFAQEYV
ncbi:MAG: hypothetical protein IBJ18_04055 [Phycisphaerales bacterium]|nr:hypothetical protein [Phycisphaerales bacterium]